MPRRSDHTRTEIREMIVGAGQKIIQKSGISALSTRKIASNIGYTVGTLYHFFDNYDDIILHINSITLNDLREHFSNNLDKNQDPANQIKQSANIYLDFIQNNYNRWSILFEYKLTSNEELPEWYKEKIDNLFEFIKEPLSKIVADQETATKQSKILWSSIHGISALAISQKLQLEENESTESLCEELINNYLNSLNTSGNENFANDSKVANAG